MKKILVFFFILIFFTACEKKEQPTTTTKSSNQTTQKESLHTTYELREQNRTIKIMFSNNTFKIEGTKKVALLLFFTSWCPGCKAEMEELQKLHNKYGQKIDIIALQLDQNKSSAPFFISHNININNKIADRVYPLLHLPASKPIPVMILLQDGRYVIHYVGATPIEMVEMDIKKALGE